MLNNFILKLITTVTFVLFLTNSSFADLNSRSSKIKTNFKKVQRNWKGPFGLNCLQTPYARTSVEKRSKGKPIYFQAAFRSKDALKLANSDFYVGNLFTTNYYLLYARYIIKDRNKTAFHLDHNLFFANNDAIFDAVSMTRHTLLEQFYIDRKPKTRHAKSFLKRGVSDSKNESTFYYHFVKYLGSKMDNSEGYLLTYLLQNKFELTGEKTQNVSLKKLRADVQKIWSRNSFFMRKVKKAKLFEIRNTIHNRMSRRVLDLIKRFNLKYSSPNLSSLKRSIENYYSTNLSSIISFARTPSRNISKDFLYKIDNLRCCSINSFNQFSKLLVDLRNSYSESKLKNPDIIHLISKSMNFLQKEMETNYSRNKSDGKKLILPLVNLTYAFGLISESEYLNLNTKLKNSSNSSVVVSAVDKITKLAYTNLNLAFGPALADWQLVFSDSETLIDDILKSSPISLLDSIVTSIKRNISNYEDYIVQTPGVTYGYLRFITKEDVLNNSDRLKSITENDIPIFEVLPLYLAVTAGIITEEYQTELSHVKLKSDARGTPNIYYPNISLTPPYNHWIKDEILVRMELSKSGNIDIRPATKEEAHEFWANNKPITIGKLSFDLTETRVRSSTEVGFDDYVTIGSKASNYSELGKFLSDDVVLEGLTIPFFYYSEFLNMNPEIKKEIIETINNKEGRIYRDRLYRSKVLKSWRLKMRNSKAKINPDLVSSIQEWCELNYPGKNIRFRSSTNTEDLENFNGAGLYSSTSYKPSKPKKTIERALKKVWASIWNLRAFDERELFSIDHMEVFMGILLSPGFPDQEGEGVAVTKNIKYPDKGRAVYFNVLAGEEHSVMNPTSGVTTDEFLVYFDNGMNIEILNISNQSLNGSLVLKEDQIFTLTEYMLMAHEHFKILYGKEDDEEFALDFEFKIDDEYSAFPGNIKIQLKQARPYI